MDDEMAALNVRVRVLETLVAFQFAAQHLQTSDPAAEARRLRDLLVDRARDEDPGSEAQVRAALEASLARIESLQNELPQRLVD